MVILVIVSQITFNTTVIYSAYECNRVDYNEMANLDTIQQVKHYMGDWFDTTVEIDVSNMPENDHTTDSAVVYSTNVQIKSEVMINGVYKGALNKLMATVSTHFPDCNQKHVAWFGDSSLLNAPYFVTTREIGHRKDGIIIPFEYNEHMGVLNELPYWDVPFSNKINKVVWRGATTGNVFQKYFVKTYYNNNDDSVIDVGFSKIAENEWDSKKYKKCNVN